ncbi:MAG TPA: inositol monophosphatase family protein [Candidatus Sulfotelmatobacter sp.]|nr:inositol monophosphatase family protein [Candidatus Sulfotelmatobacter sp.]
MVSQADWPQILLNCKNNVKTHVQPLHDMLKEPQPDLGIGAGGDRTKLADLTAEKAVVETLLENGISFTLISEESGTQKFGDKPDACYATVDPIDGTTNFVRFLPFFCTSIAISDKPVSSRVFAACVTDLFHDITYTAFKDKGAFRDGKKIKPSTTKSLDADETVIGLDLNTYKLKSVASQLSNLIQETRHIRHFGANALELCYVADGLTDAFIDLRGRLRATDVAAGFFIIEEAGGILTSPQGKPIDLKLDPRETVKFVASGNKEIHRRILNLVK